MKMKIKILLKERRAERITPYTKED